MSKPYTHEERERAAKQIESLLLYPFGETPTLKDAAIILQMQLNRLMEREREARELLNNAQPPIMNVFRMEGWFDRRDAWLSHKPEGV